jgi:hypothetical protein
VVQAGIIYVGELAGTTTGGFAALNTVFAFGWLMTAVGLKKRLARQAREAGRQEL